ncbi:MAG TPA: hypothetical protein VGK99_18975 [Acidobacteriota bacterium]|jgi:tetratricopeptide (TPR) repeat protein
MKSLFTSALALALTLTPGYAMQAAQSSQSQGQTTQPAQKPPRVLGQPQTREEYDAYDAITKAADLQQRAKLSEDFLQKFPDSGLAPFVHQIAATTYQQLNNFEKLAEHGEAALKEIPSPGDAVLLTILSSAYADRGKPDLALERAEKAAKGIESLQTPPNIDPAEFAKGKNQLLATIYSAKGVAYLVKAQEARAKKTASPPPADPAQKDPPDPNLDLAITNLNKALELNPKDDFVYYRLGIVYTLKNDAENATSAYARSVAIGGNEVVGKMARENLKAVTRAVLKSKEGADPSDQKITDAMEQAIFKAKGTLNQPVPPPPAAPPAAPPAVPDQSKPPGF